MSDQSKCAAIKSYLPDNLCRIFMLVGSFFTFAVGCSIILGAVCLFDTFAYEMGLQVAPSPKDIDEMIVSIFAYAIIGTVLVLYPIFVSSVINDLKKGGDSQ